MFYVYEWFNLDTDFVFYVGKGNRGRYKENRRRNKLFQEYYKNNNCDYRILKQFEDEQEAFEYEKKRIIELKAIGQASCNGNLGGGGGLKSVWTVEAKKKWSANNPMKNEKQRKRMMEHNPMKNKEVSRRVAEKISRPVIINGKEYKSVLFAAQTFNVRQATIKKWCKKGINPNFEPCRYKDAQQVAFNGKRYNKGGCRPLFYKGKLYESAVDLAEEIGLDYTTIHKYARRGFDPNGNECRYANDRTQHIYKPLKIGEWNKKAIIVNGKVYSSKAEAEKQLGLCKGYLAPYLAGTRKNQKYICQYVNQQPSRTNTDNSSSEGSTTNR